MTARTIIVPGRGTPHDFDEIIEGLADLLLALIDVRFRAQARSAPGIRPIADWAREVARDIPVDPGVSVDKVIAERRREREAFHAKRPISQATRERMSAAQKKRQRRARGIEDDE